MSLHNTNGIVLSEQSDAEFSHSSQLHLLIEKLIRQSDSNIKNIEAIAVSKGPGSYTGLRIGSSSAKGLCVALDIPLIAIPTHYAMLFDPEVRKHRKETTGICCTTDARREDIFLSMYDCDYQAIHPVSVHTLSHEESRHLLDSEPRLIIGSGASKCKDFLNKRHLFLEKDCLHSSYLTETDLEAREEKRFEALELFEPACEKGV